MFLKRIDILGFKSFADKIGVEFSTGITAIVGPNGSGKSNIADAVRWVLGEQSARNLRGAKMEDVIFVGSESRRPINYCEVTLTLDNADGHLPVAFEEVAITRRVYRTGESEYLLNKQTCRLKDITELFMDSGLGRESYSIIGQGRIEEMLSTKPEDRRGPFEDAAGIVKFKFRRRESERKLEETRVNLTRVDDILAELDLQEGPLKLEAERAREYTQLTEELTSLEVSLLVNEIEQLKARWETASANLQQLRTKRDQAAVELSERQEKLSQTRQQFEEKNMVVESLQRQLMDLVEERQRTEGNLALLQERLANANQTRDDRRVQKAQMTEEETELGLLEQQVLDKLMTLVAKLETRTAALEVAAQAVDPSERVKLESLIGTLNAELIETHQQAAFYRNELKSAEESLEGDVRKRTRIDEDLQKWIDETAKIERDLNGHQETRSDLAAKLGLLDAELVGATDGLRQSGNKEAACVAEMHTVRSQIASTRSRIELLKELEEGYDGYALGVKTVLQAADKQRLKGVHGSLAALVRVPRTYEQAIETALGGALQNIVVQSEADARAAIQLLKARQAGRATFMPIEVVRPRTMARHELEKVEGHQGFVGVASTLVECEPHVRPAVDHLLGNVVVAAKLEDANALARQLDYRIRIVTLEGDVVSPGGVMSGGSHVRKGPGLLGRSRELQDMTADLNDKLIAEQRLVEKQTILRGEITDWQRRQATITESMKTVRDEIAAMDGSVRELETRLRNAQERLEGARWEHKQLEDGRASQQSRLEAAKENRETAEVRIGELEQQLVERRRELEERDRSHSAAQEHLTGLRVEVATLTQERDAQSDRQTEVEQRLARIRDRMAELENDVKGLERVIAQTTTAIEDNARTRTEVSDAVVEMETRLAQVRELRRQAEEATAEAERLVREGQQNVTSADDQLHRSEVQVERADADLGFALTRIGETYHMTYEWAKAHFPLADTVDQVEKVARKLRTRVADLGEVRVGAIEEWERVSHRIGFLRGEREDLQLAEDRLRDVIKEIDDEMSRRFQQTFDQIRIEFQTAFRNLFGGGRADLHLTDPADPLQTGIEVTAQPPGKKLQNLNLLSGGERALTAMALLFAILKVRPVPFCILDEVEAALDEANVSRFAQQLRKFSDETQFIVITHRRGTMEDADVLYGVTMQESGVSSLISVRLSDDMDVEAV